MRDYPSKSCLFKGRHFEQEIILLYVRWYLRYKLSYRDLVEMTAERGVPIAHTTILRWVQRYAPEFDKRRSRFAASAGTSWRVDETYVRICGRWAYLYRAVDASGKTVDFRLSPGCNVASAKAFFRKAIHSQGRSPETITLDGYAASHRLFANFSSKADPCFRLVESVVVRLFQEVSMACGGWHRRSRHHKPVSALL